MKKTLLLIAASLLLWPSCKPDDPEPVKPDPEPTVVPQITVSDQSQLSPVLTKDAGTAKVSFTTNVDWTASVINTRADAWVSVSPTSGKAGSGEITISVAENDGDERGATIRITASTATKDVVLTQKQKDAFTATASKLEFGKDGGNVDIEVTSNIDYTYAIDPGCQDWIKHTSTRATQTNTLSFTVSKNDDVKKRSGTITVTSALKEEKFTVYQEGETPTIVISQNEYTLSSDGGPFNVEVKSNVDVAVEMPSDTPWLTEVKTKGMSTNTFTFSVAENTTYDSRSAVIHFVNVENGLRDSVTVNQTQLDAIIVAKSEYEVPAAQSTLEFDVQTNVEISVTSPTWIKRVETKALETLKLTFTVEKYEGLSSRTGDIVISGAGKSQTVKVTQTGVDPKDIPSDEIWYTTESGEKLKFMSELYPSWGLPVPFTPAIKSHTYGDGKGVIKLEGPLESINYQGLRGAEGQIPYLTSIYLPSTLKTIDKNAFYQQRRLTGIVIPDAVETINRDAFAECDKLEAVTLPSSLKTVGGYIFRSCPSLKEFRGESDFLTEDRKCFIYDVDYSYYSYDEWGELKKICVKGPCIGACVKDIADYVIPDDIVAVENYAFDCCQSLHSITVPIGVRYMAGYAFQNSPNLEYIYGTYASGDNKSYIYEGVLQVVAPKGLKEYSTPSGCTSISDGCFAGFTELETLTINDEVKNIKDYAFTNCPKLRTVTLPISLVSLANDPFQKCPALESVYLRSVVPPTLLDVYYTDFENLTIYIPEQSASLYDSSTQWAPYKKFFATKYYPELEDGGHYISKDYSRDGMVTQLQKATEGSGIDLVLMGDAFSDRQIADGTYGSAMNNAMESFFGIEPYKSFRHLFNVYQVDVVSASEGYVYKGQALETYFGQGTYVGGNDATVLSYAAKAVSEERMENVTIIAEMNRDYRAGTCVMLQPETHTTYGAGPAICYFPTCSNQATRSSLVHHEAGGHGFGKLIDEYWYADSRADQATIRSITEYQGHNWYMNIAFTDDLTKVPWARFIQDERYAGEDIGAYEGCSYEYGAYRPSDWGMMRNNTLGFNAPSREAIYKRIHALAYGSSWTYDYETFVKYDEVNRNGGTTKASTKSVPSYIEPVGLHAPVVLNKTWRETVEDRQDR